jgi:hypothetical protein
MKKKLIILSLLYAIFATSCASKRKVKQEHEDITTKEVVIDKSVIETKIDENTKVIDCTSTDEIIITPIDNNKPIFVNGKTYKNVVLKTKKVKNNITTDKVVKVAKKQQKNIKIKSKENIKVKQKETEKTFPNLWWLFLVILVLVYIGWRNRKNLFM